MDLRNKHDKLPYIVMTECDEHEGFLITAVPWQPNTDSNDLNNALKEAKTFCMHYRTLQEFCDEWEDF